jgi:exonuclease VII small subunit
MWKRDEAVYAPPELASNQTPDLASLGHALVESLVNEQSRTMNSAVVPENVLAESNHPRSPSPTVKTYTDAVNEFTKHATAFIEQLPLLTKARAAYEEAMRASAEIRKVLDAGEETLRNLMTQLEQGVKSAPGKKNPEAANAETTRGSDGGERRVIGWP